MHIRRLTAGDIPSLGELYRQFWNEESNTEKMYAKFRELQENGHYIFLCAEDEGNLAGSVMGIVCEGLYGECLPFLVAEDMIVDEKHRKKGVGKALFAELEREAKRRGCTQVILVTETGRADARGFYESMGFHPAANKGYKKKL